MVGVSTTIKNTHCRIFYLHALRLKIKPQRSQRFAEKFAEVHREMNLQEGNPRRGIDFCLKVVKKVIETKVRAIDIDRMLYASRLF